METDYKLNFAEELKKCTKCGTCRYHCPLFNEVKGEFGSPRGRLALIKRLQEGKIQPSDELADILYTCLLCKTCTVNCPSGVIGDQIIMAARDYLDHNMNRHFMKKLLLRGFLIRPGLLYACMSLGRIYQKVGLHSVLTKTNLIGLLPEKFGAVAKMMPDVTKKPASERLPKVTPAKAEKKFRVAYFLGCATNLIYPDVPIAGVKVLSKNGCEVVIPEGMKCCGMPHFAYGDTDAAVQLAKNNIEVLLKDNYDAIVTDCASCASTLIESYIHLFDKGTKEHEMAEELQSKVWDISKFLMEKTGIKPGDKEQKYKVTYHDPCHLKRGLKIFKEPREVLKNTPGVEFAEMKEADRCCGSAGSFTIMHHDLSMKVLDRKVQNVQHVEPHYVATSCPTCTMQLAYGLKKAGSKTKVVHPIQLLAQSYNEMN